MVTWEAITAISTLGLFVAALIEITKRMKK